MPINTEERRYRTKPTLKQKAYARALVKHKFNGAKAVQEVYNTTKRGKEIAYQNNKKPAVQEEIKKVLNEVGLSIEYIAQEMKGAIEYNKGGKPSQSVLADLLKQGIKLHQSTLGNKGTIKQERKILLDKDYNILKEELTTTLTKSKELLEDLG